MEQTNVFGSCLVRQVNEAVRIEMSKADCVMNSKSEFHQALLVRVAWWRSRGLEWTHDFQGVEEEQLAKDRVEEEAEDADLGTSLCYDYFFYVLF